MKKCKKQKVLRYYIIVLNVDREGYYRQLLMLFIKWRKEEIDFLYGCYIYEESYMKVKDEVEGVKV